MVAPRKSIAIATGIIVASAIGMYQLAVASNSSDTAAIRNFVPLVLLVIIAAVAMSYLLMKIFDARRGRIGLIMLVAVLGSAWLGPITGSTADGGNTFLVPVGRLLTAGSDCRVNYGASSMDCVYKRGYDFGFVICILLGILVFACIVQLIRLWVRKRLR